MEPRDEALGDLARFLAVAGEYVEDLVLVGGWVPFFYRNLPGLRRPTMSPS